MAKHKRKSAACKFIRGCEDTENLEKSIEERYINPELAVQYLEKCIRRGNLPCLLADKYELEAKRKPQSALPDVQPVGQGIPRMPERTPTNYS